MDHTVLDVSGQHRHLPRWSHPTLVATGYLVLAFVASFFTRTIRLDISVVVLALALWPVNPSAIAGALLGTVAGNLTNSGSLVLLISAVGTAALVTPAYRRTANPDTLPSRLGLRLGYMSLVALAAGTFEHRFLVDRNRWAEHTLHVAIGIFVGAVVISFMRRRRIDGPVLGTASMLTATAASVLFTIAFWDQRDESLLRLTNETVSVGLLQGITDDLNVVNTKATSATDLTPESFPQSLQVTVLGNDSVRGVQMVEFDTTGAPVVTAVLSEFGTEFDDTLTEWVLQQDATSLQSSVAFGVSEYLDLVDLPTLDGTVEPNLVYVVPLFPDANNLPRVMVFTLGLPALLEGAITPTIAAQGNASVDVYSDTSPGAAPLWSNNGGDDTVGPDGLVDQSATLDVTSVTIGTTEFVLTARPGIDFGTPTRFRRLILGLEGVGGLLIVALLLIGADQNAQREHERRRREALLAAALQGSPGWTAVIDTNDRVVMANNNEHGVPAGALVTESMVCSSDHDARTAVLTMLERARAGEDGSYTHHWSAPDDASNSMRIFQIDVRPLPDPRLVYLQCVDVTEQRDRAMRTAQSERMEAIGVLAGSLAHDFNNLLFITLGYLQMLERQPVVANDTQASTFVSRAVEAVERGATVAKSLLSFARSQPLEATAINMHTFLHDLRPLVDQAIHGAHDLHVDVEGEGLDVVVDPGRLSSGLLNIVFNARDAMESKGSITIRVRRGEATASDGAVREMVSIAVTDTGKGMSPEVVARAFEPFFTTKQVGSGTGLGLATVYSFAQQSGGWATIDSTEGVGTTVTILLPPAFSEALTEPAADTATEWAVRRVLVIDDEPALADLVAAWISDLGLSTRTANSPEDAFKVAEEFKPQLVVSDANLRADMDGLDVARELVEQMPSLVVIFMTGFSDRIKALQAAGVATLAKPFTRDDLVKVLSQNVGVRHDDSAPAVSQ